VAPTRPCSAEPARDIRPRRSEQASPELFLDPSLPKEKKTKKGPGRAHVEDSNDATDNDAKDLRRSCLPSRDIMNA